jgi:hypothetical protein
MAITPTQARGYSRDTNGIASGIAVALRTGFTYARDVAVGCSSAKSLPVADGANRMLPELIVKQLMVGEGCSGAFEKASPLVFQRSVKAPRTAAFSISGLNNFLSHPSSPLSSSCCNNWNGYEHSKPDVGPLHGPLLPRSWRRGPAWILFVPGGHGHFDLGDRDAGRSAAERCEARTARRCPAASAVTCPSRCGAGW